MFSLKQTIGIGFAALVIPAAASDASAREMCSMQGLDLMRNLNGTWKGKGAVTPIGGAPERISCNIGYTTAASTSIRQTIQCAGTDWNFKATSQVTCEGNVLDGTFEEKVAHNTGSVRGSISGNHLDIEADSPNFKGHFNVTFNGETKHLVSITQFDPAKGRQVPVASIQLTR